MAQITPDRHIEDKLWDVVKLIVDDYSTANIVYVWEAIVWWNPANPIWRIKKIDQTQWITLNWAKWESSFTNIWNDRLILNYN